MKITIKFTVATEEGLEALLKLTRAIAIEKFSKYLEPQLMEEYIQTNFNDKALVVELNSMSNQWLIAYVDNIPAGFVQITSKGVRPSSLERKRAIRIANFGVLKKYVDSGIEKVLLEKSLIVCKPYEAIWINEYIQNPLIGLFESRGFVRQKEIYELDELPLNSLYLIALKVS
ncbi:N-acetyltransferase [Sphingobacterium sp. SG20118]|uniref:N-acetyltransferase n=1 Tax=Sphingobacterium sp. SG20118 TaxID=3367156 RepID=UPI0037DFC5B2